jgi:hypothetical protein
MRSFAVNLAQITFLGGVVTQKISKSELFLDFIQPLKNVIR